MSEQATVAEMSAQLEEATTDLRIPDSELVGVPRQFVDAVTAAGLQAFVGTIAFAGQQASGSFSVQYNTQNTGYSSAWPQWAFELAKAALLANKQVFVSSNGDPFGSNLVSVLIFA